MTDPVAAITEADATGETAAIFTDIRAVLAVGGVNLIWRHLATIDGALPWAWGGVRPLYIDGTLARAAARLRATIRPPALAELAPEVLGAAGLSVADQAAIAGVLAAYDRTNPMALVALSVLRHRLANPDGGAAHVPGPVAPPEAPIALPTLLPLTAMAPHVAHLVTRLNRIGTTRTDPLLASMWRHLSHWPPFLALAWTMLRAPGMDAALLPAIDAVLVEAGARARDMPITATKALPATAVAATAAGLARFAEDALARMVIVCGALRAAGSE